MKLSSHLSPLRISNLITSAEHAVEVLVKLPDNPRPESNGGSLTIISQDETPGCEIFPLLVAPIGKLPPEKVNKYLTLSQEKAKRLHETPLFWSSWQTRDLDKARYGGAVAGASCVFSFSGLPEEADEALVLALAMSHDDLSWEKAEAILSISKNRLFKPLWKEIS
jgi:hypothetical protein